MIERLGAHTLTEVRRAYNKIYARAEYGDKEVLYDLVLARLGAAATTPVLDVACGAGSWLSYLADRGYAVLGCELSDEALRKARARVPGGGLLLADGACLPFAAGRFEALTCLGSLEHFLDPRAGAGELRRLLAPGGRVVIMLPNAYYSGDIWRVIKSGYGPDHHQVIDRFATLGEWRDLLEGAGLRILTVDRYDKGKLWKRLFPFNLAYHFVFTCERG